jgi:predicted nicotinamide N-methyase
MPMARDAATARSFITANTRLLRPPLVPEIVLHLAEESLAIWQKTEDELQQINLPPPFWAFAWAGGQALARYILDYPALVSGKRVLDLGAGSGLAGIAAMKAGASHVHASEIDAFAIEAIALNAHANDVSISTVEADLLACPYAGGFGTVLVGDLFYDRNLAGQVQVLVDAACADGANVLIGDPQRSYFPRDRFEHLASYAVPVTRELEDAEIKQSAVWRARIDGATSR